MLPQSKMLIVFQIDFFPNLFGIWDLEPIAVIRGFQMQILLIWNEKKKKVCEQWPSSVWGRRAAASSPFLLVLIYSSCPSMNVSCLLLTLPGYLYGLSTLEVIIPCILKIYSMFFHSKLTSISWKPLIYPVLVLVQKFPSMLTESYPLSLW